MTVSPGSVAAAHLLADVHVMLGQRELARPRYSQVADAEPGNGEALNNLGVFHLMRNEHARAIPFFRKASEIDSSQLAASFNLAQIYSERLEIGNSERQLAVAREVDADQVSRWIAEQQRFVPLRGGFDRLDELQSELREQIAPHSLEVLQRWQSWGRSLSPLHRDDRCRDSSPTVSLAFGYLARSPRRRRRLVEQGAPVAGSGLHFGRSW